MPSQNSSISSRTEMPAGASFTPGFTTRPDTEKLQALAATPAMRGEPVGALLDDVAHPVERLDVLLQRRAAEEPHLRHIGRAMAGQAALALDRLDHRGFFAADIGAGAAAQMDPGVPCEARRLELGDLGVQHQPDLGILVAQVEIDVLRID